MKKEPCPSCGVALVAEQGASLHCPSCGWHLISREEWQKLSPHEQGYILYMQGSWPTSELAGEQNPYEAGSAEWIAFHAGAQHATLTAQDGEE